jgi:hypothetical protein
MDSLSLIENIQAKVIEIYRYYNLFPLRGRNDDFKHEGFDSFDLFHASTQKGEVLLNTHAFNFDIFHDLIFCSDELVYFTAHLYLYRPFINSPIEDVFEFAGRELFPNRQNISAKRYNMYTDVAFQKLYNFWDRIGDLIASYFPVRFPEGKPVYFTQAVEAVPVAHHVSKGYRWLQDFKNTGYQEMNRMRKSVVHHLTTDTLYFKSHLENASNRSEIENIQKEREAIPDFFLRHNSLTIEGFKQCMDLLRVLV